MKLFSKGTRAQVLDRNAEPGIKTQVSKDISREDFPYAVLLKYPPMVLGRLGVLVCKQDTDEETRILTNKIAQFLNKEL